MNKSITATLLTAILLLACSSEPTTTNFQFSTGKPSLLESLDSNDLLVTVTIDGDEREFLGELRADGRWNVNMNVDLDTRHTFVASWYASGNSQRLLLIEQTGEFTASSTNTTVRPETSDISSGSEKFDSDCDFISNLEEVIARSNPLSSPGCTFAESKALHFKTIDNPRTGTFGAMKPPAGFVSLEGGCFLMEHPQSDASYESGDFQNSVCVDPFSIGRYEVTFDEYSRFSGTFGDPAKPVTAITYFEAHRYTQWLSSTTGRSYRLPTEAEWEYAARGKTQPALWSVENQNHQKISVNDIDVSSTDIAPTTKLFGDDQSQYLGQPREVGTLPPNSFGLYDMQGNVTEFTCSEYSEKHVVNHEQMCSYDASKQRVVRGGNYLYNTERSSIYHRPETVSATQRNDHIGFRVVLEGS